MLLLAIFGLLSIVASTRALNIRGADVSSIIVVEDAGHSYTDSGARKVFEDIMVAHGANAARVRVWTAGQYNTEYALELGKRIKSAGMKLIVDLHFSDTWADPGHQSIPSAWPKTLSGLNTEIYTYTQSIVSQFVAQGTPIDILQIGNEINNGMLWPVGEISANGYDGLSQLLHSAVNGAKSVGSPQVLLHLANGWDSSGLQSFFKNVFIAGAFSASDFDILGVSFYPFYGGSATLASLKSSLTSIADSLRKPIIVAETDWPVSCPGVSLTEPSVPISVQGQETWIKDITSVLNSLPNGLGQGILYWEPGWIGSANLGSGCADNLLVSSNGATRDSISIFDDM